MTTATESTRTTVPFPTLALAAAGLVGVTLGIALLTGVQVAVLAVVMLAAVLFAVAVLAWPDLATIAVVVLIFSNAPVIGAQFHGLPYLAAALVPALLLVPIVDRLIYGRESMVLPPTLPFLLAFLLVEVLSTLLSRDPAAASAELWRVVSEGAILYLLVVNAVRTVPVLRHAAAAVVATAAILAALSTVQLVAAPDETFFGFAQVEGLGFDPGTDGDLQQRASGPIGEKNFYAQMLLAALPLAVAFVRVDRGATRLLAAAAAILIAAGVVLTFSRGAAVAAMVLLLAALALRIVRGRVVVGLALAAVLVTALVPSYAARLATLTGVGGALEVTEDVDPVIAQRANDVLAATAAFADHPVLGVGPGLFAATYREYATRVAGLPGDLDYAAHNLYLEIASETGLLGLAAFGGLVTTTLIALVRARRSAAHDARLAAFADAFILVVISYLATGLFLHISYQRYVWLFLALSIAGAMAIRRSIDEVAFRAGRA